MRNYREKEPLDFALAGGLRVIESPHSHNSDSLQEETRLTETAGRKAMSRTDSLFLAMLNKAREIRAKEEKSENHSFTANTKNGSSALSSPPDTTSTIGRFIRNSPPNPDSAASNYSQIVHKLRTENNPVKIVIGRGKKYWIGTLATLLFPFGSQGYYKTLDWIVENNPYYKSRESLNMVRTGDTVVFPTKKMIQNLM
ncbi:MAG: hypothetical protein Kow0042_11410 [Calditrichia bacterium]